MQFQSTAIVPVGNPINSVQYEADMAQVLERLDALERGLHTPAGSVVVISASYESLDGRLFYDNTAEVQALQDAITEFYVYSETKPRLIDPFVGVVKLERVTYRIGGRPMVTKVFAQYDRIVLD